MGLLVSQEVLECKARRHRHRRLILLCSLSDKHKLNAIQ